VISAAIGGKSLAGTVCSTPWDWHEIHDLAAKDSNSITDGLFGSKLKTEHYTVSGPRVIRLQNVGDGVFVDEKAHISPDHFASLSKHRVYPGDLVIAALGETLPRACLVPDTLGPAIVKADCIRFKPGGKVLSKYLMYALNAAQTRRATKARLHGVGRPRLNLGEIKSIVVPVPPLSTQEVIVAEVERRLSTADEGEAQIDASLRRPEALRQAILKRAFEAGSGSDQGTN
jgi:type I restriction enzyme S subunit